jgi:taurine dioxygenase
MTGTVHKGGELASRWLHPLIGIQVQGVDLGRPLSEENAQRIHRLWMEGLLLVFPDQPLSDEQHMAFGRNFGDLEVHPSLAHRSSRNVEIYRVSNVDEAGNIVPPRDTSWQYLSQSWRWHTDSSFREIPSKGSILHGIQVIRDGGDTLFANMYAAYDELPDATKKRIEPLWVVHDHDHILSLVPDPDSARRRETYDPLPPVTHPLVQVHPETRRRSLFLSPHTMTGIEGMADGEGRALLDELIAHATRDRFVYRHQWSTDDVIMWDNRCTMHSVEPFDNVNLRRVMHRVTLVGEGRPIPAGATARASS